MATAALLPITNNLALDCDRLDGPVTDQVRSQVIFWEVTTPLWRSRTGSMRYLVGF